MMLEPLSRLVRELGKLPGIGQKSAQRLAFHLLRQSEGDVRMLAAALLEAKQNIHACARCGNYTDRELCDICADPKRQTGAMCVVQQEKDIMAMERTHAFGGAYHVLGGSLSPMDGIGADELRIAELMQRIEAEAITEVILATNPDIEGEATALYIADQLRTKPVRVTRIAHGVPIGGNLEYVDELTLSRALQGRREI